MKMKKAIIGKKVGMTQIFDETGKVTTEFNASILALVPYIFLIMPIGTMPGRKPGTLAFLR